MSKQSMIQRIKSRFSTEKDVKDEPICNDEAEPKAEPTPADSPVKRNAEGMITIPVLNTGRRNYY